MLIHTKMYMVTFVISVLSIFIISVIYMLVAYNYDWLSRYCCCCKRRRDECDRCGQEISTVSRHAQLRGQMELPPDYNKCGGLPPAYELVVAGNPPAYSEAIQLEVSSSLALATNATSPTTTTTTLSTSPVDATADSSELSGIVVVPADRPSQPSQAQAPQTHPQ